MTDKRSDFEIIRSTLADTYGGGKKGDMVYSLAEHITENLPLYAIRAEEDDRTVEFQMMLTIWNWYSGGSTAEAAAKRICVDLENAS